MNSSTRSTRRLSRSVYLVLPGVLLACGAEPNLDQAPADETASAALPADTPTEGPPSGVATGDPPELDSVPAEAPASQSANAMGSAAPEPTGMVDPATPLSPGAPSEPNDPMDPAEPSDLDSFGEAVPASSSDPPAPEPLGGQSGGDPREALCLEVQRTQLEDLDEIAPGMVLSVAEVIDQVAGTWPADSYRQLTTISPNRELLGPGSLTFSVVDAPAYLVEFELESLSVGPSGGGDAREAPTSGVACLPLYDFELDVNVEHADVIDTTVRARFQTTTSEDGTMPSFVGYAPLEDAGGTIAPTQFDPAQFWDNRVKVSGALALGSSVSGSYAAVHLEALQEPFDNCAETNSCDGIVNRTEYVLRFYLQQ